MRRRLGFLARGNSATPMASGPAASKAEPAGKERAALTYQTTSMLLRFGNWAWQEAAWRCTCSPLLQACDSPLRLLRRHTGVGFGPAPRARTRLRLLKPDRLLGPRSAIAGGPS